MDCSRLDRLYRLVLVAAGAIVGGLLLYWLIPDLAPHIGENGAALFSWFLIIVCGVSTHWLLRRTSLARVSRVLAAVLASGFGAASAAAILIIVLDFPVDQQGIPQVLLIGFSALGFAFAVYLPIYLIQRKLARSMISIYVLTGTIIPAAGISVYQPLGQADFEANLLSAVLLGLIGACSAVAFGIVAHRVPMPGR